MENLSPQILRQVAKEIAELHKDPPEGVQLSTGNENLADIEATLLGPAGTPYAGGRFRVRLVLGKNFPAEPPKAFFLTRIFHPNVANNGEICVNTLKKDWKSDYGIKHILLTIKCLLIIPNAESALNEEAGKLLLEHYEDYFSRAKLYTEIHAAGPRCSNNENSDCSNAQTQSATSGSGALGQNAQSSAKKHPADKNLAEKLKKDAKRKTLKRL